MSFEQFPNVLHINKAITSKITLFEALIRLKGLLLKSLAHLIKLLLI